MCQSESAALGGSLDQAAVVVFRRVAHPITEKDHAALDMRRARPGALGRFSNAVLSGPLEALRMLDAIGSTAVAAEIAWRLSVSEAQARKHRNHQHACADQTTKHDGSSPAPPAKG